MTVPGSYANGFAPRDGQPLYPELWRGCVGAWNPGLGPTGLTLRDWSGFGRHGALTNGPIFAAESGRYSIEFDGVNDKISSIGSVSSYSFIHTTGRFSLSFWSRFDTNGTALTIAGSTLTTAEKGFVCFRENLAGYGVNVMRIVVYAGVYGVFAIAGSTDDNVAIAGSMDHWCYTSNYTNTTGQWYKNGTAVRTTTRLNPADSSLGSLGTGDSTRTLGLGVATFSSDTRPFDGKIDDVLLYDRELNARQVAILATRRGISYELAPRRRSRIFTGGFKAYLATRKAQIIGGGM